jgi:hypothetical protein
MVTLHAPGSSLSMRHHSLENVPSDQHDATLAQPITLQKLILREVSERLTFSSAWTGFILDTVNTAPIQRPSDM